MSHSAVTNPWIESLAEFLRSQPSVGAVRIDPVAQKVSLATLGEVDLPALEAKLAATIAGVEAGRAAVAPGLAPKGFALSQDGNVTVLGRKVGHTAEELWLWREFEWPAITAEPPPHVAGRHLRGGGLGRLGS